jgi:subtilisin
MFRSRLKFRETAPGWITAAMFVLAAVVVLAGRPGTATAGSLAASQARAQDVPVQTTFDWRSEVASADSFATLLARAQQNGSVRAIVGLQVLWTAEGQLSEVERSRQRDELTAAADAVLATIQDQRYRVVHKFSTLPLLGLELSPSALTALERSGRAAKIEEDKPNLPALATSVPLVEANDTAALGFGGKGETIAILDTGVDANHPFLAGHVIGGCGTGPFCLPDDPTWLALSAPCTYTPNTNLCQHGTHVAGIAAGANGTFNGKTFSGVAPEAKIVSFKVTTPVTDLAGCTKGAPPWDIPCPEAYDVDIIWALVQVHLWNSTYHFAAVNLSFGSGSYSGNCIDFAYLPAVAELYVQGIPFVVSSGNDSSKNQIESPACLPWVVSVGNTTKADTVNGSSDSSSILSLLAPGTNIVSSFAGSFQALSGTSMAAPHVTGAFAVLRQRFPNADVPTLLNALQQTGKPVTDAGNGLTKPRIRLLTAMVKLGELPFHAQYASKLPGGKIVSEGTGIRLGGGTITINTIPTGASIPRAYLYFMTVNGADADADVLFNGSPVQATLVGGSRDPCTANNGSAARVYRADVSGLVTGNGSYTVSGVGGSGSGEGASLVLVTAQPAAAYRVVLIQEGAMTALQGETISHTFPLTAASIVGGELNVGLGAGDGGTEGPMTLGTATAFAANAFNGSDGAWWDDRSTYVKAPTPLGPLNSLTTGSDCLTWAYAGLSYAL